MRLRDKLILAGLVLATGGSGAYWFRKTGDEARPATEAAGQHLVLREEFRPNAPPDAGQTPGGSRPVQLPTPVGGERGPSAPQTFDGDSPLPNIAPNYQPSFNIRSPRGADKPGLQATSPLTPLSEPRRDLSPVSFGANSGTSNGPFPPLARNVAAPRDAEQPVTHRVVDGDTLARLAEQYLGNSSRRLEIFEANRRLLKDPDVLPIGADLKIPPQNPVAAVVDANAPAPLVPLHHGSGR